MTMSGANFAEIVYIADYANKYKKYQKIMIDLPIDFFARKQDLSQLPLDLYSQHNITYKLKAAFSINEFNKAFTFLTRLLRNKVKYLSRDNYDDWNLKYKCN